MFSHTQVRSTSLTNNYPSRMRTLRCRAYGYSPPPPPANVFGNLTKFNSYRSTQLS